MYFNVQKKTTTVKHKLLNLYSDSKATSEQKMKIVCFFCICRIIPYAFAANTNKYFRIEKD